MRYDALTTIHDFRLGVMQLYSVGKPSPAYGASHHQSRDHFDCRALFLSEVQQGHICKHARPTRRFAPRGLKLRNCFQASLSVKTTESEEKKRSRSATLEGLQTFSIQACTAFQKKARRSTAARLPYQSRLQNSPTRAVIRGCARQSKAQQNSTMVPSEQGFS